MTLLVGDRVTRRGASMVGTIVAIDTPERAARRSNGGVPMARVMWPSGSTSLVTITDLTREPPP